MARILIIDKDPAGGALASGLLRARGHAVQADGSDPAGVDLVLCGARHPAAFALAARKGGAVLLALCAAQDAALRERLLAAGYDGYIGLPFEPESFAEEVEVFLPPSAPQPVLLLVDDDPFMLDMLADVAAGQGWRVLLAGSGEEALALAEAEAVGVIVSDQRMPGMSGAELLAAVRARRPDCVRILLSGQREDAAIDAALRRGDAERFLAKPWEGAALLGTLHAAFALGRARGGV